MTSLKSIISLLLFTLIPLCPTYSQNIKKGSLIIEPYLGGPNFGFILGNAVKEEINNRSKTGYFSINNSIGPNGIRGEFLITDKFSIGFDYIYNEVNGNGYVDSTLNELLIEKYTIDVKSVRHRFLIKANYHFITNKHLDVYGGIGLGYNQRNIDIITNIPSFENKSISGAIWPVAARLEFGLTYYPIKPLGINFELGLGGPIASIGIVLKLNTLK